MKNFLWSLLPSLLLLGLVVGVLVFTAAFTLVERKLMGLHQRREGPDRVGFEGLGQPFADGLKLLRKETLLPKDSPERRVFFLAPLLSLWVSLLLWTLVPLSPAGAFVAEELGLLLVLGISSLGSYGVIYAGWASNNKYALLGAFRAVAQFISYEIIFSLLFLPLIGVTGSANLQTLVDYQVQEGWFSYLVPLWGLSFLVILAETNRTPFDLPEAEAELVAGFNVEYSSLLFAFFFLAEYSAMGFFGALLVTLFFGGYSLVPLGWGWDGDRPLDDRSSRDRAELHGLVSSKISGLRCEGAVCRMGPRRREYGNRPLWDMDQTVLYEMWRQMNSRLQQLGWNQHRLRGDLSELSAEPLPHSKVEPPWIQNNVLSICADPSRVDLLFRALHQRTFCLPRQTMLLNHGTLELYRLWDAALLGPLDFRNPVLWAALLPGLVGVPVLALKVQLMCLAFITVRASLPRLRFDQLTSLCWKYLFPLALSGSLLVVGLHYGFTVYFLARETRLFGLYWLPHYGSVLERNGFPAHMTRFVNTGFWQMWGTTLCVTEWDLQRLASGTSGWESEMVLQRRWWRWDLGRSWFFWDRNRTPWWVNLTNEYLPSPNRVVPPLAPDHPQYGEAQMLDQEMSFGAFFIPAVGREKPGPRAPLPEAGGPRATPPTVIGARPLLLLLLLLLLGYLFTGLGPFPGEIPEDFPREGALFPQLFQGPEAAKAAQKWMARDREQLERLLPRDHPKSGGTLMEKALAAVTGKSHSRVMAQSEENFRLHQQQLHQQALVEAEIALKEARVLERVTLRRTLEEEALGAAERAADLAQQEALSLAQAVARLQKEALGVARTQLERALQSEASAELEVFQLAQALSRMEAERLLAEAAALRLTQAQDQATLSFVQQALEQPEVTGVLDRYLLEYPELAALVAEATADLGQFGSDGLIPELMADNPGFWLGAAAQAVAHTLLYLTEVCTVADPAGSRPMTLANHLTHYQWVLSQRSPEELPTPKVSLEDLLSLGVETSWNSRLSGMRLEQAIQDVLPLNQVQFPQRPSALVGVTPYLLGYLEALEQSPPVELDNLAQSMLMRGPKAGAYHWNGPGVWHDQYYPLSTELCGWVLNQPDIVPPGLNPVNPRDLEVLARYLMEQRALRHGLPGNILEFTTGCQSLLWADMLHQSATLLWLDQIASLHPAEAGHYALPPKLEQLLVEEAAAAENVFANPLQWGRLSLKLSGVRRTPPGGSRGAGGSPPPSPPPFSPPLPPSFP